MVQFNIALWDGGLSLTKELLEELFGNDFIEERNEMWRKFRGK